MYNILLSVLTGAAAGWLASKIFKSKTDRFLINMILGMVGGFLGFWILDYYGIYLAGRLGAFVTAVVGASILIVLGKIFSDL